MDEKLTGVERRHLERSLRTLGTTEALAAADELLSEAIVEYFPNSEADGADLARIYEQRSEHVRRIGLDARGLSEAVEQFARTSKIGSFAMIRGARHYLIFMDEAHGRVVACVSTPGDEFDGWDSPHHP